MGNSIRLDDLRQTTLLRKSPSEESTGPDDRGVPWNSSEGILALRVLHDDAVRRLCSSPLRTWGAVVGSVFEDLTGLNVSNDCTHLFLLSVVDDVRRVSNGDHVVRDLCTDMARAVLEAVGDPGSSLQLLARRWVSHVLASAGPHALDDDGRRYVCAARLYMSEHYGEHMSTTELARRAGCSRTHLATVFRRLTGATLHESLIELRMERAIDLLKAGVKVEAVCPAVGFRSRSSFFARFKQRTGLTPAAFRALQCGQPERYDRTE